MPLSVCDNRLPANLILLHSTSWTHVFKMFASSSGFDCESAVVSAAMTVHKSVLRLNSHMEVVIIPN